MESLDLSSMWSLSLRSCWLELCLDCWNNRSDRLWCYTSSRSVWFELWSRARKSWATIPHLGWYPRIFSQKKTHFKTSSSKKPKKYVIKTGSKMKIFKLWKKKANHCHGPTWSINFDSIWSTRVRNDSRWSKIKVINFYYVWKDRNERGRSGWLVWHDHLG